MQGHSGVVTAAALAVGVCSRWSGPEGVLARDRRGPGAARALALLPSVLPGGYAWLSTRHVTEAASCLKEREGTVECSAVPKPVRGLGWRPADG